MRWPMVFVGCSGVMGAAGVAIAAAGAHLGGGDLARTASDFLLIHAAAVLGLSGVVSACRATSTWGVAALSLLTVGATLFGGALALASLADWRPLPLAAPTGGLCLIAGWLSVVAFALSLGLRRRED